MNDKFYNNCVVCFDDTQEMLLKCKRCVYRICKRCILDMGDVDIKLCKERECKYDYLEEDEDSHCYICSKKTTDIVFNCPTCTLKRNYKLNEFTDEIVHTVSKNKGLKRFGSSDKRLNNFHLVFSTILDLDTGKYELLSFRTSDRIII